MRIPFCVLSLEVEKLYQKEFPEGNDKAIEEHCNYISDFILACGYSVEEYFDMWIKENDN